MRRLPPKASRSSAGGATARPLSSHEPSRQQQEQGRRSSREARRAASPPAVAATPAPPLSRRLSSAALLDLEMPLELDHLSQTLEADMQRLYEAVAESIGHGATPPADPALDSPRPSRRPCDECSQQLLDITLLLDSGGNFQAHAAVLAARCHFFRGLFRSGKQGREQKPVVQRRQGKGKGQDEQPCRRHGRVLMLSPPFFHPSFVPVLLHTLGMRESQSRQVPFSIGHHSLTPDMLRALLQFIYCDNTVMSPKVG